MLHQSATRAMNRIAMCPCCFRTGTWIYGSESVHMLSSKCLMEECEKHGVWLYILLSVERDVQFLIFLRVSNAKTWATANLCWRTNCA